jgi:phosphate butyryltransferase
MIRSFVEILKIAKEKGPKTITVAAAEDKDVLEAIKDAKDSGIINGILIGNKSAIEKIAQSIDMDLSLFEVIDIPEKTAAAKKAVELVSTGKAQMVMKGSIGTADILKAVLDKEIGLRTGRVLSHVGLLEVAKYHKLIILTDGGMNIAPDLQQKKEILQNAIDVAHGLGIEMPKVAPLAALELVNPDMQATIDAAQLSKMADRGQIKGAIVDGPLAFDNAISMEAAEHKGIKSPVAGDADILLVPNIETGNVLYKSIVYFADSKSAGIIVGAKAPIVLVSRSDSPEAKLNSIALAVVLASKKNQ